jgi:O-antigen ligase
MFNLLIFIFLILYFLLCLWRLDWAVLFLISAIPSYLIRFSVLGVPSTLLEGMILTSFAVWFLRYSEFKNFVQGKYKIKDYLKTRKKRIKYPFGTEIILVLIISFIAVGVAHFSNNALGIWKAYFFEPLLVFILVLNVVKHDANTRINTNPRITNASEANAKLGFGYPKPSFAGVEKIIFALAISAFLVSTFAIYQKFTGAFIVNPFWANEATRRVTSFFPYPNAVGLFLAPLALVFIGLLINCVFYKDSRFKITSYLPATASRALQAGKLQITSKFQISNFKPQTFFIVITIILSLLAIFFAKSEGAIVGVVAGLFMFGLFAGKKSRWATLAAVLILLAGVLSYAPARSLFVEKITLNDLSGQIRKEQWVETKKMLYAGYWFWGIGLDNYEKAIKPFHQEGIFVKNNDPNWLEKIRASAEYRQEIWQPTEIYHYPHNIVLNFWTELGLLGMILFVWIMVKYAYLAITNYKLQITNSNTKFLNLGLVCAMMVIIIHGLVDVSYFKNDLAVIFWLFVAMLSIINLNLKYYGGKK